MKWVKIQDNENRYRLLCSGETCSLSLANLFEGRLHVSNIHGKDRHSYTLNHREMLFVINEYFNSLSEKERETVLELLKNNLDKNLR